MPYRIDIISPPRDTLDQLVRLGALDIEQVGEGLAAILPDDVTPETVVAALGVGGVIVSPAVARDNGSVWLLSPRAVRIGGILIAPPEVPCPNPPIRDWVAESRGGLGALRLTDSASFGTGHHPTTALCIEAIEDALSVAAPDSLLDVGTGSGVLALSALMMGVPEAVGLDIVAEALETAAANARMNGLEERLQLVLGGPDAVDGVWPLVVANVLAAPLIEMAPVLVRRVASRGRLILSGIPSSVEFEVRRTYQWLGMRHIRSETRGGWTVVVTQASW